MSEENNGLGHFWKVTLLILFVTVDIGVLLGLLYYFGFA
jgi:hypothetical protein